MTAAKICGLSTSAALDAALSGGARYVGFVQFAKSPRHVGRDALEALFAQCRGKAETAIVVVDPDDELLNQIAPLQPDWIQLHGAESPKRTAEIRRFARRGVIKALAVGRSEDLALAGAYEASADMFLFDAKPPPGGLPGGNAIAFDWQILAGRRFARPWFLSGGLTPENVREAITASQAQLVDVSSGVETAPGLKDPRRIAQFLAATRA